MLRTAATVAVGLGLFFGVEAETDLSTKVLTTIKAHPQSLPATPVGSTEIRVNGPKGDVSLFLDNLQAECLARPASCNDQIKSFVDTSLSVISGSLDAGLTIDNVLAVLRPEAYVANSERAIGDDIKKRLVYEKFVPGIFTVFVIDTPKAIRVVNRADLEVTSLTQERLGSIALTNIRKLPQMKIEALRGAAGVFVATAKDGFGSSRILDTEFIKRFEAEAGGALVFAVPTRDWIAAVRRDGSAAQKALRVLVGKIVRGEPNPVSDKLFYRDGTSWREFID